MRVFAGQTARVSLHAYESGRIECPAVSVAISQSAASAAVWSLRIEPRFDAQAVVRVLGRVETVPPTMGAHPSSVAAIACAPGAVGWFVEVERVRVERSGAPATAEDGFLDVDLSANPDLLSPGVTALAGAAIGAAEIYSYQAGVVPIGASSVNVPVGGRVLAVSVWQSGAGGTVAVGGGPAVPLPPNGAVQLAPAGGIIGPLAVDFAAFGAAGGYLIERVS